MQKVIIIFMIFAVLICLLALLIVFFDIVMEHRYYTGRDSYEHSKKESNQKVENHISKEKK